MNYLVDLELLCQSDFNFYLISEMDNAEFRTQVDAQIRQLTPTKTNPVAHHLPLRSYARVSCKVCGLSLGNMADVRKFGQSHFLILDATLCEKVKPFPDKSAMKPMDGKLKQLCEVSSNTNPVCPSQKWRYSDVNSHAIVLLVKFYVNHQCLLRC